MRSWQRLRALAGRHVSSTEIGPRSEPAGGRVAGEPPSPNGASSLHLWWQMAPGPLESVAVTLEVVEPPELSRLYFWALQVSFADRRGVVGAGHLGLQWYPGSPPVLAVNWGGYREAGLGGGELDGTTSALPAVEGNRNTRRYSWQPRRRYRLSIEPAAGRAGDWRGVVTDEEAGEHQEVRVLHGGGDHLVSPVVWSEVFARYEHPRTSVRWSDPLARRPDGSRARPAAVTATYQPAPDGGCDNTTAGYENGRLMQITNAARTVPHGATIVLAK